MEQTHKILPTVGQEGKAIAKNAYAGKTLAVFTSGGDAQGMDTFTHTSRNVTQPNIDTDVTYLILHCHDSHLLLTTGTSYRNCVRVQ